ncbi:MAG: 3'-5' exonuclease, partial [Pseudohongiellaceae bacterium]
MVNWVNQVFQQAFPAEDDIGRGAVRYAASTGLNQKYANAGVEILLFSREKNSPVSPDTMQTAQALKVAELVCQIQEQSPQSSIAILVRTRSHIKHIITHLRRQGLRWNASEIDSLQSYPVIQDLISLCRALLNLSDTSAWLALLRTPWIGLSLADIHRIAMTAKSSAASIWQTLCDLQPDSSLSDDSRLRLQRVMPALRQARNNRQRLPLRQWLEALWMQLGGPATLGDAAQLSPLDAFFRQIELEEQQGDLIDIHHFEDKIAGIYASDNHGSQVNLQIMTIHKAKGLEFDHVIIPGLDRRPRSNDNALMMWREYINRQGEDKLIISMPA